MSLFSQDNFKKEMTCRIILFRILFHKIKNEPMQDPPTGILSLYSPMTSL